MVSYGRFAMTIFKKTTAWLLACGMVIFSLAQPVRASIVPAEMSAVGPQTQINRQEDLRVVQKALENKMISQRLKDMGLTEEEIQQRLSKMSDQEVHQLASQMQALTPGGDGTGIIVGVLVIVV